jgi:hypothetical protein
MRHGGRLPVSASAREVFAETRMRHRGRKRLATASNVPWRNSLILALVASARFWIAPDLKPAAQVRPPQGGLETIRPPLPESRTVIGPRCRAPAESRGSKRTSRVSG